MQTSKPFSRISALLAACLLTACAGHGGTPRPAGEFQPLRAETGDLAAVSRDALSLAAQAGRQAVLVVFDIDNTLLAMEQGLGSDQWYDWQKSLAESDVCNPRNVGDRLAVQGALYFASAMRPTQPDAAQRVAEIQQGGIRVLALSSRGPDFRLQTFRELRRNGLSFAGSAIGPAGGYPDEFAPLDAGRASRYEDGVFLTAGQHKGRMLYALLEKTGTPLPDVIVTADDKQKSLDEFVETFSALGVPVHAWRYTGEDAEVRDFDRAEADRQWRAVEGPLRQLQKEFGPDHYDLSRAAAAAGCR